MKSFWQLLAGIALIIFAMSPAVGSVLWLPVWAVRGICLASGVMHLIDSGIAVAKERE